MIRNGLAFTTFVTIVLAALLLTPGSAIAAGKTPREKLKPVDVLNNGFYKIKNFSTGD